MQNQHPLDRLVFRLRKPIIFGAIICAPIMLASYAWMVGNFTSIAPLWLTLTVVPAHFVGWIAVACLFDQSQERRQSQQDVQS